LDAQFDREKVPERVVHARGIVAKGYFEVCASLRLLFLVWELPACMHAESSLHVTIVALPCSVYTAQLVVI